MPVPRRLAAPALVLLTVACGPSPPAPKDPSSTPASAPGQTPPSPEEAETLDAQIKLTTSIAHGLRVGAAVWLLSNPVCPTADDIVRAGLVSPALRSRDMWETPYRISCNGDKPPVVTSAGPDLSFGTADDIVASDR